MKTKKLLLLLIFAALTTSMCKKDEKAQAQVPDNKTIIPLSEIPDNPGYLQLPLEGVKWKLVGYGDIEKQEIDLSDNGCGKKDYYTYTCIFEKGRFNLVTCVNICEGDYETDSLQKKIQLLNFICTKVGEDPTYKSCISCVETYEINAKGLYLYYAENKQFLLFIPIGQNTKSHEK